MFYVSHSNEKLFVSLPKKGKLFSLAISNTMTSNNFMLSFTRGSPIALALDKTGKIIHTIFVTPEEDLPDIAVDDPLELIDELDVERLRRSMRLGQLEARVVMKAVQSRKRDSLNEEMKRAFDTLELMANSKLKREILFTDGTIAEVIPLIGQSPVKFDRSIAMIGGSGAGKSFLAKKILKYDRHQRPIVVFSKVVDDPSLADLKKQKTPEDNQPRLIQIPIYNDNDLVNLPTDADLRGNICLFDDIDAFGGERAQFLRDYRDALLEAGRHKDVSIISTSHILSNYNKTRTLLNEAEWVFLFPNSNRRSADVFLKDRMGQIKSDRDALIARSGRNGRYLGIKMSAPNLMLHRKGVMLI